MTLKNKDLRDDCDVLDVDLDQSDDGFELDLRVYHLRPKTAQLVGIHVSKSTSPRFRAVLEALRRRES